jgi:hypothetical protein
MSQVVNVKKYILIIREHLNIRCSKVQNLKCQLDVLFVRCSLNSVCGTDCHSNEQNMQYSLLHNEQNLQYSLLHNEQNMQYSPLHNEQSKQYSQLHNEQSKQYSQLHTSKTVS